MQFSTEEKRGIIGRGKEERDAEFGENASENQGRERAKRIDGIEATKKKEGECAVTRETEQREMRRSRERERVEIEGGIERD